MATRYAHPEPESRLTLVTPSPEELRPLEARARQMQAETTRDLIVAGYRRLADIGRTARRALGRRWRQAVTRSALEACSDRTLADIGIARENIPLVARGLDPAQHAERERPAPWWESAHERLSQARARRRKQLQVYRELMLYSDEELNELGIRRRDVDDIARAA